MKQEALINLCETLENGLVGRERFPLFDESTDDEYAHPNCIGAIENIGCHEGTVFGEGMGECGGEFEGFEVVAICDHLAFFFGSELEAEIFRKTLRVAFNLLIEAFRGDAIDFREVRVDYHGDFAKVQNRNGRRFFHDSQ